MKINSINNAQNFQARIKINKSNLKEITTSAGLGTTAAASLAAQTDFDIASINATAAGGIEEPSYKGVTLPLITKASDFGGDNDANLLGTSATSAAITASVPLTLQYGSITGYENLEKLSDKKISRTYNNIDNDKRLESAISDAATIGLGSMMLSADRLDNENLVTLGTIAMPVISTNFTNISEAYDKTIEADKKLPS